MLPVVLIPALEALAVALMTIAIEKVFKGEDRLSPPHS